MVFYGGTSQSIQVQHSAVQCEVLSIIVFFSNCCVKGTHVEKDDLRVRRKVHRVKVRYARRHLSCGKSKRCVRFVLSLSNAGLL